MSSSARKQRRRTTEEHDEEPPRRRRLLHGASQRRRDDDDDEEAGTRSQSRQRRQRRQAEEEDMDEENDGDEADEADEAPQPQANRQQLYTDMLAKRFIRYALSCEPRRIPIRRLAVKDQGRLVSRPKTVQADTRSPRGPGQIFPVCLPHCATATAGHLRHGDGGVAVAR